MLWVVFWLWELGMRKKLGKNVFWTEYHPNFAEEGSFWLSWLHASVKVQQKSGGLGLLEPLALYRNCMEYLLIFLGHFAGTEFVTEFVIQMNRHLRITPVQHLQDKMWVSSQAKVKNQARVSVLVLQDLQLCYSFVLLMLTTAQSYNTQLKLWRIMDLRVLFAKNQYILVLYQKALTKVAELHSK